MVRNSFFPSVLEPWVFMGCGRVDWLTPVVDDVSMDMVVSFMQ
jgi:hypothetical protein